MTAPAAGPGRRRWWLVVVAVVVGAIVLSSCSGITSIIDTQTALQNAGFGSVQVKPDVTANTLSVSVSVDALPVEADAQRAALVVWQSFHERFDRLSIAVHGGGQTVDDSFTFAQLEANLGTRNPSWNRTSVEAGTRYFAYLVIGVVGGVLALVVVIVLLVQRRRRRRRPPGTGGAPWPGYPPGGYPPGAGGGYPPGPGGGYPPPGYGRPPGYPDRPPPADPPRPGP